MVIDQVGLPDGEPGFARRDGLSDGSLVTLTDTAPGGTTKFDILWVSSDDTSAIATLQQYGPDPHVWVFGPTAGVTGPIRIQLTHTEAGVVTTEIRIFGIPDVNGLVPPAPGERSDPSATRLNMNDPGIIARCERNWKTDEFPNGNPFGWAVDVADHLGGGAGGGPPAFTRRFIDVQIVTERPLPANSYEALEGGGYTITATDPAALWIDGQSAAKDDLVLVLWELVPYGLFEVIEAGDNVSPWVLRSKTLDWMANSENVYRARTGDEHAGRLFASNTYGYLAEPAPSLRFASNQVSTNAEIGPGIIHLPNSFGANFTLTIRNLLASGAGSPGKLMHWRIAVKAGANINTELGIQIAAPPGQSIEGDDGSLDNYADFWLTPGQYREWVFFQGAWILIASIQRQVLGA